MSKSRWIKRSDNNRKLWMNARYKEWYEKRPPRWRFVSFRIWWAKRPAFVKHDKEYPYGGFFE